MPRPTIEPSFLCLKLEPGESRDAGLTILKAPTASDITVSIADAVSSIVVKHLVALRPFERPLTEEEILELPPFPPSIREKARNSGAVKEYEEITRNNGDAPLSVAVGDMVQIVLECSAYGQKSGDVILATLAVKGTAWETVEVPLVLLTGKATHLPSIEPAGIRRAAEPGETLTQDVVIASVPTASKVVAFIANGGAIIRLTQMVAFRPVKKQYTDDEIEELSHFPPSVREDARRNGYVEYKELGRSNGLTPLAVFTGDMVRLYVEFSAPEQHFPDLTETILVIEGTTWHRVEIPVYLIIGKISIELSTSSLSLRHDESGKVNMTLTSLAGPGTYVDLKLGDDDGKWRVEPPTISLPKAAVVTRMLRVHLDDSAPTGTFQVGFDLRWFDRLQFRNLPFELNVKPGLVTARLLQTAVVTMQGDKATCQVEVVSVGGHKFMELTPLNPPRGVRMVPVARHLTGVSTTVIPVELSVDPQAPMGKGMLGIHWDATDGEHRGVLFLDVTVNLIPDSRTFHQAITTPTGTALGGWAEITIRTDGSYTFRGHMHDSGFDPYAFRINVVVRSASGKICLALQKSGRVAGTLGSGSRDFDWNEIGNNGLIPINWTDLRAGNAMFSKWYEDTGVFGTLEDIGLAVGEFFVANVFVGPLVAAAVVVGSELGATTEIPFLHPTVLAGVFVAGGIVLLLGPGVILPAVVAGIATGAQVQARPMREPEKDFARKVFADSLPFDRILITNFDKDGTGFCTQNVDSSILICLGDRFDDPLRSADTRTTLIHELMHAWQIAHYPLGVEIAWQATINTLKNEEDVYGGFVFDGRPWSGYPIEHQAVIVGSLWYNVYGELLPGGIESEAALNSLWFRYIQDNIRLGVP